MVKMMNIKMKTMLMVMTIIAKMMIMVALVEAGANCRVANSRERGTNPAIPPF